MSIMDECFKFAMKWEGGSKYTNDPDDAGGPTKYGVALNYNKEIIKELCGEATAQAIINLTYDQALEIYKRKYWTPCRCDLLPNPTTFVYFDMCLNIGQSKSPKLLQECLNKFGANLVVDGIVGKLTSLAAANRDQKKIVQQLTTDRIA